MLLVVEVADTSLGFDRSVKLDLYARAGFPEYWLADVNARTVTTHRAPVGAAYDDVRVVARGATLSPLAFPDLLIPVADLFA